MPTLPGFKSLAVIGMGSISMLGVHDNTSATAQTLVKGPSAAEPRFKRIELRMDHRDVRDAVLRQLKRSGRKRLKGQDTRTDARFLVDIDPAKLSATKLHQVPQRRHPKSASHRAKSTVYDRPGGQATEFVTEYPARNAQLRCYWAYDQKLARLLAMAEARAREDALEREARNPAGALQQVGSAFSDDDINLMERSFAIPSGDPEFGASFMVRRQFKKAGRPCQLDVLCVSSADAEANLSKRIGIIQRERKDCQKRADDLVGAMTIIRIGQ